MKKNFSAMNTYTHANFSWFNVSDVYKVILNILTNNKTKRARHPSDSIHPNRGGLNSTLETPLSVC